MRVTALGRQAAAEFLGQVEAVQQPARDAVKKAESLKATA